MGRRERMSSFLIEDIIYEMGDESRSDAMDVPLSDVITPGSRFTYHYPQRFYHKIANVTLVSANPDADLLFNL